MNKVFRFFKRFWWIFLIGFLIGGFITYRTTSAKTKDLKDNSYTVKREDLIDSLTLSGKIDAKEKVELRFQTSGLLSWVGVKEGDYVKKFQVVASLDKRQLKNQLSQQLNDYMKNRWTFEQAQQDNKDWQSNGMTDLARDTIKRTLEKNQFDLNNAVLDVEANDLTLKFANLWTPIEGLVTQVDSPYAGINITPATAAITVINPKTIYLSTLADQTEVVKFAVGQKCDVVMDSFEDKPLQGSVERIAFSPKIGESGTVYELLVRLNMPNDDYKIKMGMTGDATFVFNKREGVLTIPDSYVKERAGKKYVVVLKGEAKEDTNITTGVSFEGVTEVLTGLKENDVIYN